jgi:Clp amino terminal domain, pathogenicity island component
MGTDQAGGVIVAEQRRDDAVVSSSAMFELTDRARRALELAQEDSRQLSHNFVGTDHILLGLIRADGMAAEVLTKLGVSYEMVRAEVAAKERHGSSEASGNRPNQSSSSSWVGMRPRLEEARRHRQSHPRPAMPPPGPGFSPTLTSPIDVTGNGSYTVTGGPVPLSPGTPINPGVAFPRDIKQYFKLDHSHRSKPYLVTIEGETYVQASFTVREFEATYSGLRLWIL